MTTEADYNDLLEKSLCLEHGPECSGDVEFHTIGTSLQAWPRCEHHAERRWERYENSIEKYADSDVEPDWFDPTYAGERWSDDY